MKEQKFNQECTCPLCGSQDVTYDSFEQDVETGWNKCCCNKCNTTWNEIVSMKFMYVDDIVDENGNMIEADETRNDITTDEELNSLIETNYSEDYFDDNDKELFKMCNKLINMIRTSTFEWDTFETDEVLHLIKDCVNRVDI